LAIPFPVCRLAWTSTTTLMIDCNVFARWNNHSGGTTTDQRIIRLHQDQGGQTSTRPESCFVALPSTLHRRQNPWNPSHRYCTAVCAVSWCQDPFACTLMLVARFTNSSCQEMDPHGSRADFTSRTASFIYMLRLANRQSHGLRVLLRDQDEDLCLLIDGMPELNFFRCQIG
jgi:hypothetical protein